MLNLKGIRMTQPTMLLKIDQANVFYNYTIGLATTEVDLLKTAGKLLKSELTKVVCFSDLKCLYIDDHGEIQLEWVQPEGRQWDPSWKVSFGPHIPQAAAIDLAYSIELLFHEQRIEAREARQVAPYLRAALPPIVLESGDLTLPLYAWIKVFSDGIFILSFQLDTTWDGIEEEQWISDIVNLFQRYFNTVWVNAKLQRLDADHLLPHAFHDELSVAGQTIGGRKTRKLLKKMRRKSKAVLNEALGKDGREFEIGDERWVLHKIAGSDQQEDWEATIDLCRSQYVNAIADIVVPCARSETGNMREVCLWQGRPSVSLMRFREQPSSKDTLLMQFGPSMSRIMMRSALIDNPPELPPDLRPFEDYCFHGNRALLLWTWLRSEGEPDDAWEDPTTRPALTENQARAEHFEYLNMRVARACAIAGSPPSYTHLVEAYDLLVSAENLIHHSSQAGEISDALLYLISAVGTAGLVPSGKERARWRLDELRYRAESRRVRTDRLIGVMFGLVGAAGLADLVFKPYLTVTFLELSNWEAGLFSFIFAALVVGLIAIPIWTINRRG